VKCIVCGKEIDNGYVCGECRAEREEIVRVDKFEILVCSRCEAIRVGDRWVYEDFKRVFEDLMLKNTQISEDFNVKDILIDLNSNLVTFTGEIAGDEVSVTKQLNFRIRRLSCPKCSREAGGYYESVVQIRAENREVEEEEIEGTMEALNEILEKEKGNEKAFATKIERTKEGLNIFLGSRNIGMKLSKIISRKFGGSITESKKLHTRIDGRDVYRFTYSVRFPEYRNGDVVERKGKLLFVKNVQSSKGIDILTGKTANINGKGSIVVKREEMKEGVVVNADDIAVEIVCDDGKLVTTLKPFGAEIGSEVKVFEHKGGYYSFLKGL